MRLNVANVRLIRIVPIRSGTRHRLLRQSRYGYQHKAACGSRGFDGMLASTNARCTANAHSMKTGLCFGRALTPSFSRVGLTLRVRRVLLCAARYGRTPVLPRGQRRSLESRDGRRTLESRRRISSRLSLPRLLLNTSRTRFLIGWLRTESLARGWPIFTTLYIDSASHFCSWATRFTCSQATWRHEVKRRRCHQRTSR
jgi:hypothetical protein